VRLRRVAGVARPAEQITGLDRNIVFDSDTSVSQVRDQDVHVAAGDDDVVSRGVLKFALPRSEIGKPFQSWGDHAFARTEDWLPEHGVPFELQEVESPGSRSQRVKFDDVQCELLGTATGGIVENKRVAALGDLVAGFIQGQLQADRLLRDEPSA